MVQDPKVDSRRLIDASWLTALPLLLNVVSLGANGFIIRTLGENGYGTLVVAMGLSGATVLLSNLGMRALYTKAVAGADDETTERLLSEQLGLRLVLGILAGAISTSAAAALYRDDLAVILCTAIQSLGMVVTIGWTCLADVLNARERFAQNAKIGFLAGLTLTALSVIAAASGGGPVAVAAAYLIGPIVNFGLQIGAVRSMGLAIPLKRAPWARYRKLFREARALAANDLLSMINSKAEGIWAPLLFGKALIGVNSAGMLPASRMDMASDGVATAFFPSIATAHSDGDETTMQHHAAAMFTLMLAATLPLALFVWFGAPFLAVLLFPESSQIASADLCTFVARTSALALPITAVGVAMRYALQAAGLHSRNAKDQMLATVIGAGTSVVLALAVGIKGLAIAVVARSIIVRFMQAGTFRSCYPKLWQSLPWRKLAVVMMVPLPVLYFGVGTTIDSGFLRAGFSAVVAGILALTLLFRTGLVDLGRDQ